MGRNIKRLAFRILIFVLVLGFCIGPGTLTAQAEERERISGPTRYETAEEIAEKLYAKSGAFKNIVVAYGGNFPDALSGGYLAKVKNAPIILVNESREDSIVEYINKRAAKKGNIYLLGGSGVISTSFEEKLLANGFKVKRLGGKNRYETNLNILREAQVKGQELLVASASSYADSIAASSTGRPILLVGDSLNSEQKAFLQNADIGGIYILGGKGAVAEQVRTELKAYGNTQRIAGVNRYETSAYIAKKFFGNAKTVTMVSGRNYPDGLAAGPWAAQNGSPILLVNTNCWTAANNYVCTISPTQSYVLGGVSLIDNATASKAMDKKNRVLETNSASNNNIIISNVLKTTASTASVRSKVNAIKPETILTINALGNREMEFFQEYTIQKGDGVYNRIYGKSFVDNSKISLGSLRYLRILHYDYRHRVRLGEMIVDKDISQDVLDIFKTLFEAGYEIESMRLIDDFWKGTGSASDDASIKANNTSAFCYRVISGSGTLSEHAYGHAIDVNPKQNPYYTIYNGRYYDMYEWDKPYVDRTSGLPHMILKGDICQNTFNKYGFFWGGDWTHLKDYQHFER